MPLNASLLVQKSFPVVEQRYGPTDAILYALGLGLGLSPTSPQELPYVLEDAEGQVRMLPAMASVLAFPPPWGQDPAIGADWRRVVHAEQRVDFHTPLPPNATVRAETRVERVTDKGPGKGALVQATRSVLDAATGHTIADVTMLSLARGDGGCGHAERPDAATLADLPDVPARDADGSVDIPTSAQAALVYRLSGDRNRLHADPATAKAAGFDRPILHGLASFGIATHGLVHHALDGDASRLASIGCRFSDVVFPGESLRLAYWHAPQGLHFRLSVPGRNTVALSRGFAALRLP
ncbi:MaoC family dehydratase [Hydrogenophaga palleronii]|uniref:MaoC family dehydratase n=1 Tax=Hydrogenophaga palleronii TaxID=65655 RepID=UPI0009FFB0B6|nr:MaoC family dehydratase [Hydrogenophaga palleronii]